MLSAVTYTLTVLNAKPMKIVARTPGILSFFLRYFMEVGRHDLILGFVKRYCSSWTHSVDFLHKDAPVPRLQDAIVKHRQWGAAMTKALAAAGRDVQ
jgi:hypothetical protein